MLIFISAIRSNVALKQQQKLLYQHNDSTPVTNGKEYILPNAVIMICKLLIIKAKLIHKVSSHLLDLVV